MKNRRPDLSAHEATPGLLAGIFPQLGPISWLFENDRTVYNRSNAPVGLLKNFIRAFAAAALFMAASILASKFAPYLPGSGKNNILINLTATFFGLPMMLIILLSLNQSFDLFYLMITGSEFARTGSGMESVKIFILVLGFVASLTAAVFAWFGIEGYFNNFRKSQEMREEQKEYFAFLDKGRAAWNEYITSSPKHNISFSGADLSKRTFKGFFFEFVDFKGANLSETVFEDCSLSYACLDETTCHHTSFRGSYLVGADFKKADFVDTSLNDAFGNPEDFAGAKIDAGELKIIQKPEKCRWHGVSWYDFRSAEWLKQRGWWGGGKEPLGLPF